MCKHFIRGRNRYSPRTSLFPSLPLEMNPASCAVLSVRRAASGAASCCVHVPSEMPAACDDRWRIFISILNYFLFDTNTAIRVYENSLLLYSLDRLSWVVRTISLLTLYQTQKYNTVYILCHSDVFRIVIVIVLTWAQTGLIFLTEIPIIYLPYVRSYKLPQEREGSMRVPLGLSRIRNITSLGASSSACILEGARQFPWWPSLNGAFPPPGVKTKTRECYSSFLKSKECCFRKVFSILAIPGHWLIT